MCVPRAHRRPASGVGLEGTKLGQHRLGHLQPGLHARPAAGHAALGGRARTTTQAQPRGGRSASPPQAVGMARAALWAARDYAWAGNLQQAIVSTGRCGLQPGHLATHRRAWRRMPDESAPPAAMYSRWCRSLDRPAVPRDGRSHSAAIQALGGYIPQRTSVGYVYRDLPDLQGHQPSAAVISSTNGGDNYRSFSWRRLPSGRA